MNKINIICFKIKSCLNNDKVKQPTLRDFFHSIKKDKMKPHDYSFQNKNPVKIQKNILYFNHFFNNRHFQIKYDLTNKRDTVIRVKSVTKDKQIETSFEQNFSERNEIISMIKQLSR
jgi:hypothetical protein